MPTIGTQLFSIVLIVLSLAGLVIFGPRLVQLIDLWRRTQSTQPSPSRAYADLSDRIRALEARLVRLEAERLDRFRANPAGAEATADRRADAGQSWPPARRPARREEDPILITVPDLATVGARSSAEAAAEFERRFGPLWSLADEGLTDDEIAARTGYPSGQVALILGLRRPPGPTAERLAPAPSTKAESTPFPRGDAPDA